MMPNESSVLILFFRLLSYFSSDESGMGLQCHAEIDDDAASNDVESDIAAGMR